MIDTKGFQAGDEVVVWPALGWGKSTLQRVARVTPSGRVILEDGAQFDAKGQGRRKRGNGGRDKIRPARDCDREPERWNAAVSRLRDIIACHSVLLPIARLEAAADLLDLDREIQP